MKGNVCPLKGYTCSNTAFGSYNTCPSKGCTCSKAAFVSISTCPLKDAHAACHDWQVEDSSTPQCAQCRVAYAHEMAAHAHKLPFVTGRWTVAAVDSVPIDRALKNINLTSLPPMDNPWQVPQAAPYTL